MGSELDLLVAPGHRRLTVMIIDADAILFDSDGVLVASDAVVDMAWRQLAGEFAIDTEQLMLEFRGVRAVDVLGNHLPPSTVPVAVDRLEQIELELAARISAVPGAAALASTLPAGSWAIVTSAGERLARARWLAAGIQLPEVAVTAETVTNGKPDPEPYLVAADRLGVDPTRCLVFEDSSSGAEAARAAGAKIAAVGGDPWPFEPAIRIADLTAVEAATTSSGSIRLTFGEGRLA